MGPMFFSGSSGQAKQHQFQNDWEHASRYKIVSVVVYFIVYSSD